MSALSNYCCQLRGGDSSVGGFFIAHPKIPSLLLKLTPAHVKAPLQPPPVECGSPKIIRETEAGFQETYDNFTSLHFTSLSLSDESCLAPRKCRVPSNSETSAEVTETSEFRSTLLYLSHLSFQSQSSSYLYLIGRCGVQNPSS